MLDPSFHPVRRRIAIVTSGRFHVLDLGRELAAHGHEVRFYSCLPASRAARFGLPRSASRSLLPLLGPLVAWEHLMPRVAPQLRDRVMEWSLNRAAIARMEPCDIIIVMSGIANKAALYARSKFGARIYLERGSEHVLVQRAMLQASGDPGPSDRTVALELDGYKFADRIVIAASHVAAKFGNDPAVRAKLFVNRYGTDLAMFPQRDRPPSGPPTMVFAGGWVHRKGVDILLPLLDRIPDLHLIHCGNAPNGLPLHPRLTSIGSVEQRELGRHYRAADLLIAPSREEGLGLVRVQALASGIPILCSDNTGAQDLAETPALASRIDTVPINDLNLMAGMIMKRIAERSTWTPLPEADRNLLSWSAYGARYVAEIERDLAIAP